MRHPKQPPDQIHLHTRGLPATLCAATILLGLTGHLI